MRFNLPVLVYQEKNCVHNHADEIAQMGKNALINRQEFFKKERFFR